MGCALDGTIHQYATNGTGSIFARASLGNPQGEAFDKAGNLYVANETYNTITKFNTSGAPSLFYADPGDGSILNGPEGLAFDQAGNLYVANDNNNNIEKFDTNGVATVFATDDGSDTILTVQKDWLLTLPAISTWRMTAALSPNFLLMARSWVSLGIAPI